MLHYYHYRADPNNYEFVGLKRRDEEILDAVDSAMPLVTPWKELPLETLNEEPRRQGDFPGLMNSPIVPVVTERAWEALRPLIGEYAEALPVLHDSGRPHYLIHVMNTIDALDENRSELTRSMIDGRVSRVFRYCFCEDRLEHHPAMFKLPIESGGDLFVSEDFRRTVEEHGLKGLQFNPLPMVDDV